MSFLATLTKLLFDPKICGSTVRYIILSTDLCQYQNVLTTAALKDSLRSGNVMPPALIFFLRTAFCSSVTPYKF